MLFRLVEDQPNDPEYRNVDTLCQLVHMGLLPRMTFRPQWKHFEEAVELGVLEM